MVLSGSLRSHSLGEVFEDLHQRSATGVLRITGVGIGVDVVVIAGAVVDLRRRRRDRMVSMLDRLRAMGVEVPDQPAGTEDYSPARTSTVAHLMVVGQLDRDQVVGALHQHVLDELCSLFLLEEGTYQFVAQDAGDRRIDQLIERGRGLGIQIDITELLELAAQRLRDWEAMAADLPPEDTVLDEVPGRDQSLTERFHGYPESGVIALVDGVRTIAEIQAATSVPRMQVETVLYDALCENLLRALEPEEMVERSTLLANKGAVDPALGLLRAASALCPDDQAIADRLAQLVESGRDPVRVADAHAQLARLALDRGHHDAAVAAAQRAVAAGGGDTDHRQLLVRCLLESGDTGGAVAGLRALAADQIDRGEGQAARATLSQVLDLDPENAAARRDLAQAFQAENWSSAGESAGAVCLACGEVDRSGSERCHSCGESLQVSCLSCGRPAALSDRVCLFCGANPHRQPEARATAHGPTTTAIIRRAGPRSQGDDTADGGVVAVLQGLTERARQAEEAEDFPAAIEAWREILHHQPGNREVQQHLRELAHLTHDSAIEAAIERGNQLRQRRRHWRATRAYRRALRALGESDPRRRRLDDLLRATRRSALTITAIYVVAILVLGVVGFVVAEPLVREQRLLADAGRIANRLDDLDEDAEPAVLAEVRQAIAGLEERSRAIDGRGEGRVVELAARLQGLRLARAARSLEAIEAVVAAGEWARADELIANHRRWLDATGTEARITVLAAEVEARMDALAELPQRRAAIAEAQAAGRAAEALRLAEALVADAQVTTADDDRATLAALRERHQALLAALAAAESQAATDPVAALARLGTLAGEAQAWDLDARRQALVTTIQSRLAAAKTAFAALPEDPGEERLAAFLVDHGGTPEGERVARRLELLRVRRAEHAAEREALVSRWHRARDSGDLAVARTAASELARAFPDAVAEVGITVPVAVQTTPGAELLRAGEVVARADDGGRLVWWRAPDFRGQVAVRAAGHESREVAVDPDTTSLVLPLPRAVVWRWSAAAANPWTIQAHDAGWLVVADRDLIALDGAGTERWRRRVGGQAGDVLGIGGERPGWARPRQTAEGGILIADAAGGQVLYAADGTEIGRQSGPVLRSPGLRFLNELRGQRPRTAAIDDRLWRGVWGGEWQPTPGLPTCIAGPILLRDGLERALIVVTVGGELIAVDDTTGSPLWRQGLDATDIRILGRFEDGAAALLLDGSRLAVVDLAWEGAHIRWRQVIEGRLGGRPTVDGEQLHLVADGVFRRLRAADGDLEGAIRLPAHPEAATGLADGAVAVILKLDEDWICGVWNPDGGERWRRRLPSRPQHIATDGSTVVVAMEDGMLWGLIP